MSSSLSPAGSCPSSLNSQITGLGLAASVVAPFSTWADDTDRFRPALLLSTGKQREIVYVIEDHGDGQVTILVPWAPTPFAGSVKIVNSNQIEMLDAELSDVTRVLSHWGVGMSELISDGDTPFRLDHENGNDRP